MKESPEEMVVITKAEYDSLQEESVLLNALQSYGVDNWEGYEEAVGSLDNDYEDLI